MATSGTKIVIEINGNITTTEQPGDNGGDEKYPEGGNKKEKNKTAMLLAKDAYRVAKNTVVKAVDTAVNTNLSLTENYIGQQALTNVKTVLSKAESLVSSVAIGATAGGPVGAALAIVSWGTTQYFDVLNKRRSYYQALNAASAQTEFSQTRAGLYNEGKGTLN